MHKYQNTFAILQRVYSSIIFAGMNGKGQLVLILGEVTTVSRVANEPTSQHTEPSQILVLRRMVLCACACGMRIGESMVYSGRSPC